MKLKIQRRAWQKLKGYASNCQYEIGGLGKVVLEGDDFVVTDAEIFEQVVSAAHVDLTAETLAKFQTERVRAGESMRDYKLWWHSHAKMKTFFSGTDVATIEGSAGEFPWLVSLVINHAHETTARLDIFAPVHVHCVLDIEIIEEVDEAIEAACRAEIAAKVTTPAVRHALPRGSFDWSTWKPGQGGFFGQNLEDDAPPTKTKKNVSKKDRKKIEKLQKDLEAKERSLQFLETIENPGANILDMINRTEEEIADLSTELDYYQGLAA